MRMFSCLLPRLLVFAAAIALCCPSIDAQQTLGGITGEVTDSSGGVIPNVAVSLVGEQTSLARTAKTNGSGVYSFVNLPIGTYTLTYTAEGYDVQKTAHINVQADRTATVNAALKVGKTSETIEVEASPLMNAVDTTNGYVLDNAQIDLAPLATGSFTGLAIQSTGVSAELAGGTGVNSGLGNAPIWANGQRDTSNTFLLNGVDASNLFNGKSTSQVGSARVVLNTGQGNSTAGGVIQSSASVYLSIGNAIPSPAPETIQEVRVNASMYDAQQGSTAGAHLDISTKSGTNQTHGNTYIHRGTDWLNAAPFFFNNDADIPAGQKVPQLHRYVAGGTVGGALIKDKLFGFLAYQHLHVSDQEIGYSRFSVPVGLSDDRSPDGLASVANAGWCANFDPNQPDNNCPLGAPLTAGQLNNNAVNPGSSVAYNLFNQPSRPGEPGKWLIPNPTGTATVDHPYNVSLPGTAYFIGDQVVGDIDWTASAKDTLALKYYYQHDPTIAPYAYSNVPGLDQHLDAGSHVFSMNNVNLLKLESQRDRDAGLHSREDLLDQRAALRRQQRGREQPRLFVLSRRHHRGHSGREHAHLAANAEHRPRIESGLADRRLPESLDALGNAIWTLGNHTFAFGGSWSHIAVEYARRAPRHGGHHLLGGLRPVRPGPGHHQRRLNTTTFLQGNGDRYYRANQTGLYLAGQVPDPPQPEHHRRHPLRPERRVQREVRPHLQLRPQPVRRRHGR